MNTTFSIVILLFVGFVVVIMSIPVAKERKRRLQRYWDRVCTGREWRRRFPDVPKEDIRRFLQTFVDGFAFKDRNRLKFSPDDKVMAVYRALYPSKAWPDALEIETFAIYLKEEYRFDLAQVHDPEVTLGKLFELIYNPNQQAGEPPSGSPLARTNQRVEYYPPQQGPETHPQRSAEKMIMKRIWSIVIGGLLASSCMAASETEMARVKSPDGHAVAAVTVKTQRGMWMPGPEPPKVKGQWVRLTVVVDGKQKYDSGFEDVGVYQPCNFAYDLGWSPDSGHVAFRAISTLRAVGRDGKLQSFDVTKDNSLVSSFKWTGNRQLLVVAKKVAEPLDMFGYPKHYHGYLTNSQNVRVFKVDLDSGITERFTADVKEPTFMFRSIGFLNQEIAPATNRVAFSDGKAICVYDDSLGKIVATAPVNGSIEGTWWDTNERLIVGIALLSGEKHFGTFDVKTGKVEDGSSTYLPIWDSEWNNEGWFRTKKTK